MDFPLFISHLIGGAVGNALFVSFAIILGTFILEDPTTVIVGVLAADGIIPVPVALLSLYTGIMVGDFFLYCLGLFASTQPRLARYVNHDFVAPFKLWIESRFILTIFSARFIPGLRVPTFTACGFFRSSLSRFVGTAIIAASIWTTLLFSVSYWFGNLTSAWMSEARWGVAVIFLVVLLLVGRYNLTGQVKNCKQDIPAV